MGRCNVRKVKGLITEPDHLRKHMNRGWVYSFGSHYVRKLASKSTWFSNIQYIMAWAGKEWNLWIVDKRRDNLSRHNYQKGTKAYRAYVSCVEFVGGAQEAIMVDLLKFRGSAILSKGFITPNVQAETTPYFMYL